MADFNWSKLFTNILALSIFSWKCVVFAPEWMNMWFLFKLNSIFGIFNNLKNKIKEINKMITLKICWIQSWTNNFSHVWNSNHLMLSSVVHNTPHIKDLIQDNKPGEFCDIDLLMLVFCKIVREKFEYQLARS